MTTLSSLSESTGKPSTAKLLRKRGRLLILVLRKLSADNPSKDRNKVDASNSNARKLGDNSRLEE